MIFFIKKIFNYLKKNLTRDRLWFNYHTKYRPVPHRKNIQRTISLHQKPFSIVDFPSFVWQYKEIFIDFSYKFHSRSANEIIIDCGANIGLATYFFAQTYPKAKIYSFEADPKIFEVLKDNIQKLCPNREIYLTNKAVWKDDTSEISFLSSGNDAGKIVNNTIQGSLKVETLSLPIFLRQFTTIDMLKIDIEGAERDVFPSIENSLKNIKNIFLEYHCWEEEPSFLGEIVHILERNHFNFEIEIISKKNHFSLDEKMSQQYNIFATNKKQNF